MKIDSLAITVEAQVTDDVPSFYSAMHIIYDFAGKNLELKKLEQAVQLSQDKYCGVSMMYKQIMELTW